MQRMQFPAYSVIGKVGSTNDGADFVPALWNDANAHFAEVSPLAAQPLTVWGAMSAMDDSLQPWEDGFTKGKYLAGIQALPDAQPPAGWVKWKFPAYEAIVLPMTETAFAEGLALLKEHQLSLVLAVQERTDPAAGESLLVFPVKLL